MSFSIYILHFKSKYDEISFELISFVFPEIFTHRGWTPLPVREALEMISALGLKEMYQVLSPNLLNSEIIWFFKSVYIHHRLQLFLLFNNQFETIAYSLCFLFTSYSFFNSYHFSITDLSMAKANGIFSSFSDIFGSFAGEVSFKFSQLSFPNITLLLFSYCLLFSTQFWNSRMC